jgi:hypothetical protein
MLKIRTKMKTNKLILGVAALVMFGVLPGAFAVDPLYQWDFNSADGANTGTGTGGTLTADVGGATTGNFTGTGVSGNVGDSSLSTFSSSDSYWGSGYGNAAAVSSLDLSTFNQFTITMWVKRSGGNNADLLNIGSTATPTSGSNPGVSIGLNGSWDNGMRVGVNGYNTWTGDFWSAGTDNDWVFLAVAYDGTGGIWWDPAMLALYGADRNLAIITGDTTTSAGVAANIPLHIGDWGTAAGVAAVGSTATIFLASNGSGSEGYSGDLDDVRIYNSLLSVSEIDAVRLSAIQPVPEPATMALAVVGGVALLLLRRRTVR